MKKRITEQLPEESIQSLRRFVKGKIILPGQKEYDESRQIWNGMIDRSPALILQCLHTDDVIEAVNFARNYDLALSIKGGGHNVSGNALNDHGIVIDLTEMNQVHVNEGDQTIHVQGGATLGDVDRCSQQYGLAAPLGVVSKTGATGLTLSGGMGHLRRKYGLSCDNIISVDLVTADGDLITADEFNHKDLFWAIKGGGGNFGVVVSMKLQLHAIGNEVNTLFVWHHADHYLEAIEEFSKFSANSTNDAGVIAFYAFVPEIEEFPKESWGEPAFVFFGCHLGSRTQADKDFHSLRTVSNPIIDIHEPMNYLDLQTLLDEDYPDGRRYYWKAFYLEELNENMIDLIEESGKDCPSKLTTIDIWQLGGVINNPKAKDTAFWHRDKPYMITFEANWDDPEQDEANISWVRKWTNEARKLPFVTGGYANFPGFNEDPSQTVFGGNYERLVEVKTNYDPKNLFRFNTNIKPSI
ncbi:MAG TPA: FAD-binding oxidoreductase [Balneolaceae bacterium]|nr:FAD-binding oxidoreductase [Balneolaceae bacterium]